MSHSLREFSVQKKMGDRGLKEAAVPWASLNKRSTEDDLAVVGWPDPSERDATECWGLGRKLETPTKVGAYKFADNLLFS